ncbi:hypothetical protein BDW22DRAFT_1333698 [Trametopsis cervina]|nr:hypothetical protein BDW22DRAFT_1333698 [Trametopsis cervina]
MSGSKRRSTVHDLASLRLHPDGTKVANSDSNLQPRRAKYSTRDARGNWIAQDAGGLGRVKTRRSAQKNKDPESEDQESFGLSVAEKGKGRATDNHAQEGQDLDEEEYVPRDARAKKKLTFQHDLAFLDPPGRDDSVSRGHSGSSVALALESCASHTANSGIPQPSSDLLKCIHYFASTYYAEMGQLRDSSRDHRREKKRRKLERSEASSSTRVARPGKKINGVDGAYDEASSSSSEDSENETLEAEEQRAKRVSTDKSGVGRRKRRIRTETAHADVDMYKICDGSALMAIGNAAVYCA